MKLLKKFKDYFKENPKVYSPFNLTRKEVENFFFPLIDILDDYMLKSSVTTIDGGEQVHCIALECISDIDKFEEVSKVVKQSIKRFNAYYKEFGLIAEAKVASRRERKTAKLPDTREEMSNLFDEFENRINFWILIYHPFDYANTSAYKRGIKEDKPISGYPFFAKYL